VTGAGQPALPPIATVDVSLPPAPGALRRAVHVAWDLATVTVLVLALPLVLLVGAPVVVLALVAVMIAQRLQKTRA